MTMASKPLLAVLLLAALALAGCAGGGGDAGDDLANEAPEVDATETTGGIRGVVVDDAIRPIQGALVEVTGTEHRLTTDETGLFAFSGLPAGTHFLRASHPLYDAQQQSVEVRAGVRDPPAVKFLLTRVVFAQPYFETLKYDGFIVCSANIVVALSEECGEGVGVECVMPPLPCGRIGGQGNNNVQFDFTVGPGVQSVVIEQVWEPTSEAGRAFYSPISTEWSCTPVCQGNGITHMEGESPLYAFLDNATLEENDVLPDTTNITVFTWASREFTGVVLNQQYQIFVTNFYYLPAPEGWSFVRNDPPPF